MLACNIKCHLILISYNNITSRTNNPLYGKFPLEVVVKLEDVKKCEGELTMGLLRKLLNQHINTQENTQCRVTNAKGRVYTYDSRQVKQDEIPHRHLSSATFNNGGRQMYNEIPVETFDTNIYRGSIKIKYCVLCKFDHYNDDCENCKLHTECKQKLITQGHCFFALRLDIPLKVVHQLKDIAVITVESGVHHNKAICPQKFGNY